MQSISRIFKNKCDWLAQSYHINDSTCNYIKFLVVCHVLKIANIVKLVEWNEMAKRWTKKRCTNVRFNPFQWRQYSHQMNPVCSYPNVALSIGCKRLYLLYSSIECVCVCAKCRFGSMKKNQKIDAFFAFATAFGFLSIRSYIVKRWTICYFYLIEWRYQTIY